MKQWWLRRSLKLRLALWFTTVAGGILLAMTPVFSWLIERRLHDEMDNQLRIDWELVKAHLAADVPGQIQWRKESPATPDSPAYASTWFDVWAGGKLLLSHWPTQMSGQPRPLDVPAPRSFTFTLANGLPVRALAQSTRVDGQPVILRVFCDESWLRRTAREIFLGLLLGGPFAVVLAALGGYVMAGRVLQPISAMTRQAQLITSESLGERLPNPNPHDELGRLASVFNQTLQRLENSFESLKRFTADASHELRTPLTSLRAAGELALREREDVNLLRETIGSMLEEAQRLHDLIDALLLLARMDGGRLPLHLENVEVSALMAAVHDSVSVLAAEKQQPVELLGASGLVVAADRLLLRNALMNILHNAIRYSPPGSQIRARCFRRGGQIVMEIQDAGPGIGPEHQAKIFERFYRVDPARARAEGGAGLGLAIAKLSVERLGGSIHLASEPGRGSCFQIVLPAVNQR
jgi:heavy metal sensor kinase